MQILLTTNVHRNLSGYLFPFQIIYLFIYLQKRHCLNITEKPRKLAQYD